MTPTICATYSEITPEDWARILHEGELFMDDHGWRREVHVPLWGSSRIATRETDTGFDAIPMVRVARLRWALWVDLQTTDGWNRIHNRPQWAHLPVVVMVEPVPWLVCWEGRGPPPPVSLFLESLRCR